MEGGRRGRPTVDTHPFFSLSVKWWCPSCCEKLLNYENKHCIAKISFSGDRGKCNWLNMYLYCLGNSWPSHHYAYTRTNAKWTAMEPILTRPPVSSIRGETVGTPPWDPRLVPWGSAEAVEVNTSILYTHLLSPIIRNWPWGLLCPISEAYELVHATSKNWSVKKIKSWVPLENCSGLYFTKSNYVCT